MPVAPPPTIGRGQRQALLCPSTPKRGQWARRGVSPGPARQPGRGVRESLPNNFSQQPPFQ
eukprot:10818354-Heterocapsa_arctica.AAC.1